MPQSIIIITIVVLVGIVVWLYRKSSVGGIHASILDLYAKDLTSLAKAGRLDPVIGRKHELQRSIEILTRRTKNNPVLIGKSGVGKTAIVEELASEIAKGTVPDLLQGKRVLALDLSGLVAGTKYRGEFEKRLKMLVDEIVAAQRHIILFIDEIHTLAEAGEATGAINAADILKPALARGELQVVGATTLEDYQRYVQNDQTLERRFQPIMVEEPKPEDTLAILNGIKGRYEEYHHVRYSKEAIDAAVRLSVEKLRDRVLPDKAIDLIDEAGSRVRLQTDEHSGNKSTETPEVAPGDIEAIVREWADVRVITPKKA